MLGQLDQFDQLPYEDQEFITSMMGYSDPNTNQANQDPFGINVRSAFGNYGAYVDKMFNQNIGKEWKPGSWQAQRKTFYDNLYQKKEQDRIREELAKEKAAAEAQKQLDAAYRQYGGQDSPSGGGGRYDGASSKAEWSADPTGYSGSFKDGGLATMFTRKR
jgi:hypothetical protein